MRKLRIRAAAEKRLASLVRSSYRLPLKRLSGSQHFVSNRAYNTRTSVCLPLTFGVARSNKLPRFPRRVVGPANVLEREVLERESGHNLPHIERLDIRCRVTFQQSSPAPPAGEESE